MTKVGLRVTRLSCIKKALLQMGFVEKAIEINEKEKFQLKGYCGDFRDQHGELRIKGSGWGSNQNYVGGMSNDLGFEKQADGTYAFHVSEYDLGRYGVNWQDRFQVQYGLAVTKEVAEENSWDIASEEVDESGEITITLQSSW